MNKSVTWAILILTVVLSVVASRIWPPPTDSWSDADKAILESLWIGSLPDLAPDPTNAVADNTRAAEFGHELFFSTIHLLIYIPLKKAVCGMVL